MNQTSGDPRAARVERTGIALVHEGEYIGPDPASAAALGSVEPTQAADGVAAAIRTLETSGDLHFWFPVEIEVVGHADDALADTIVERVFDELRRELESRP